MPATQKSSAARKAAQKTKGQPRAKSGCFTCRLRRKKCDEGRTEDDCCLTCNRLRIQCLGFGTKRPAFLQDKSTCAQLLLMIKNHLSTNGLIKGRAGSGGRGASQGDILMLSEGQDDSATASGTSSPHTSSPSEPLSTLPIMSSSEEPWDGPPFDIQPYGHESGTRSISPIVRDITRFSGDLSLIGHSDESLQPNVQYSRALASSFSQIYHQNFADTDYDADFLSFEEFPTEAMPFYRWPTTFNWMMVDDRLNHYMQNVVKIQYLLGDQESVPDMIYSTTTQHEEAREAIRMLSSIHFQRYSKVDVSHQLVNSDTFANFPALSKLLSKGSHDAGDAIAALAVISSYLFDGGRGAWDAWLGCAYQFVNASLTDRRFLDPVDVLLNADTRTVFAIKTSIWFDVLAAVTTHKPPRLINHIRTMFSPNRSGIFDPALHGNSNYSMMSPMGCQNHVVWALAEVSWLACWKQSQIDKGCLSVPDLVKRASVIEASLLPCATVQPLSDHSVSYWRHLASEIFRSATMIYLRSVVSGDNPAVPDIAEAVQDTINIIASVPDDDSARSVLRSTVFGVFICGCLTNEEGHKEILLRQLNRESVVGTTGNCSSIAKLLEYVWQSREGMPRNAPVQWRQVLKDAEMLLV